MKEKISALELSYEEIIFLFYLLVESLLYGQESRSRNKIVNLLKERVEEFEKERMSILEKYSEKDKEGKLKTEKFIQQGEEKKRFVLADQEKFNKEFQELVNTSKSVFDVLPSNRSDFLTVKNIVLNSNKKLNYADGEIYDRICAKLEKI